MPKIPLFFLTVLLAFFAVSVVSAQPSQPWVQPNPNPPPTIDTVSKALDVNFTPSKNGACVELKFDTDGAPSDIVLNLVSEEITYYFRVTWIPVGSPVPSGLGKTLRIRTGSFVQSDTDFSAPAFAGGKITQIGFVATSSEVMNFKIRSLTIAQKTWSSSC